MKRLKPYIIIMVLALAFSIGLGGNTQELTFDSEGNYQLGGYLQNLTGLRLADGVNEDGDMSMFRNELFLDFNARFVFCQDPKDFFC